MTPVLERPRVDAILYVENGAAGADDPDDAVGGLEIVRAMDTPSAVHPVVDRLRVEVAFAEELGGACRRDSSDTDDRDLLVLRQFVETRLEPGVVVLQQLVGDGDVRTPVDSPLLVVLLVPDVEDEEALVVLVDTAGDVRRIERRIAYSDQYYALLIIEFVDGGARAGRPA